MAYSLLYFVHIIIDLLSSVAALNFIINVLEKHKLKKEIEELIKDDITKIERNYDQIMENLAKAILLAVFLPPRIYVKKIDEIMTNIKTAFTEFIESTENILRVFSTRKDTLREILGLRKWAYLEPWINSLTEKGIDWNKLVRTKALQQILKEYSYSLKDLAINSKILNKKVEKLYKDLKLEQLHKATYEIPEIKKAAKAINKLSTMVTNIIIQTMKNTTSSN